MEAHDKETLGAEDGAELPDPDLGVHVGPEGDEKDDEGLVEGVRHVDPEGVGLVNFAQTALTVQLGLGGQQRVGDVLVEDT